MMMIFIGKFDLIYNIKKLMVFVKFPNVKTGIRPSPLTELDLNNLTATQKIMLTRNRIWGNVVPGHEKSAF